MVSMVSNGAAGDGGDRGTAGDRGARGVRWKRRVGGKSRKQGVFALRPTFGEQDVLGVPSTVLRGSKGTQKGGLEGTRGLQRAPSSVSAVSGYCTLLYAGVPSSVFRGSKGPQKVVLRAPEGPFFGD